jgi:hypothetical protein
MRVRKQIEVSGIVQGVGFRPFVLRLAKNQRLTGTVRMYAPLVRGRDTGGNFDLIPPPEGELHPSALARHERVYARYRENYAEQIAVHDREFAVPA